jgi:cation diffusion facilitator family transporter
MAKEHKQSGMMAVITALGANVAVAISKFIGFAISGSAAMLNESIHSVVDCGNQILLIVGDKQAKKQASELHPFGQARAKYFFSTIVAMMLFFGGGALGVMEALEKLAHPAHEVESTGIVIAILLFGLAVEGYSLSVAFKEIRELNTQKLPLAKFLHESRHSEILIIFAEDTCAVIGLLIALAGTILTHLTHNAFWDAFSGLLIGLLLMAAAIFLSTEFYSLIVGESAVKEDLAKIRASFDACPQVDKLIDLKTVHMGPTDVMVTAKVDFFENADAPATINALEQEIRAKLEGYKTYIYIEVDEYDPEY